MKLLLDMNLPPKLADILANKGIPSVHWYAIGAPDATMVTTTVTNNTEAIRQGAIVSLDANRARLRVLPL